MEVDINEPFLNHREDENDDNISEEIAKKIRGGFIAKVIWNFIISIIYYNINSRFRYSMLSI